MSKFERKYRGRMIPPEWVRFKDKDYANEHNAIRRNGLEFEKWHEKMNDILAAAALLAILVGLPWLAGLLQVTFGSR